MANITMSGAKELAKALRKNAMLSDVTKVVRVNGMRLQNTMQRKAEFSKGYQTGTTKRSISLTMKEEGLGAEVGAKTEYAPYLEYGTRFMEAQPFVGPAFDEIAPRFLADMKKLMR